MPYNRKYLLLKIHSFDGQTYTEIARSDCPHVLVGSLAIYENNPVTTAGAGHGKQACLKRTETYDFATDQWTDQADYPYAQ